MIKSWEAPAGRTRSGQCGDAVGGGSTSSPASDRNPLYRQEGDGHGHLSKHPEHRHRVPL